MPESAGEKTEKATDHKRREERKKGNVMQSKDIVSAAFLLIVFGTLRVLMSNIYKVSISLITVWMSEAGAGMGESGDSVFGMQPLIKLFVEIAKETIIIAGPILAVSIAVTIIATGAQTKFLFSADSIKFKIDKLNPINGIKKMFSLGSAFEIAKSVLKLIILTVVVYDEIESRIVDLAKLYDMDILASTVYMMDAVYAIVMKLCLVFIAVAVVDVLFQFFKFEKDMKMTKQEVKEEYKSLEGDPQIKGKRKQIQRQMAMQRMMQAVPEADVIIRNPTHFAVAIKYKENEDAAPIVVAKGKDNIALKIVKIAEENGVTAIEDKPLARGLYDAVDINHEVPPKFYQPIASILVQVYKLREKQNAW